MNYSRLAAAALAATVADLAYGFVVYGNLMASQFGQYPAVYRPADDTSHMPYLMLGVLIAMIAATWIYAKGYEGGSGLQEGLRFGAALGVFVVGAVALVNYAVMQVGAVLCCWFAAAAFVEWLIMGAIIGLVYKPAVSPRRAATV